MNPSEAEQAAGKFHIPESIYAAPKKRARAEDLPDRPCIKRHTFPGGGEAFDACVTNRTGNVYLRRYDTREEAVTAALEYIRTGVKPQPKAERRTQAAERKATIKPSRRRAGDDIRWDVRGRVGKGKGRQYIHVGSFDTEEEAREKGAVFEATGQVFKVGRWGAYKPRAKAPIRRSCEASTITVPRAPAPVARNPWAERYGRGSL